MTYFIKKHARGPKTVLDARTPAEAEIWYDQTSKKLRYGDGATLGGYRVQRENMRLSLAPPQLTANANDFAPTGFEEAGMLVLSLDADHDFTGLAGGIDGREIWISVASTSAGRAIVRHQSANSTATNRIRFPTAQDLIISQDQVVPFRYDGATSQWVAMFNVVTDMAGQVVFSGSIAPAITADQNDWNPTNLANVSNIFLGPTAAHAITGLAGGRDGREMTLFNLTTFPITLKANSTSSVVANRFLLAQDLVLGHNEAVTMHYYVASNGWVAIDHLASVTATANSALAAATAISAGATAGVNDTLASAFNSAVQQAAGLAIALG